MGLPEVGKGRVPKVLDSGEPVRRDWVEESREWGQAWQARMEEAVLCFHLNGSVCLMVQQAVQGGWASCD